MTTQNQTPPANPNPNAPAEGQTPQANEGGQTGNGAAPGDGANAPVGDAAAQAAAAAEAAKAAADKEAADKAAAEKEQQEKFQARIKSERDAAVNSWVNAAKADPEIGGAKFEATVIDAEQGMKAVGNEKLVQLFESSGLKHHPDVMRAFAKVGALVKEGAIRNGQAPTDKPKSAAEVLYDKTPSK